jgi:hypothetical protein
MQWSTAWYELRPPKCGMGRHVTPIGRQVTKQNTLRPLTRHSGVYLDWSPLHSSQSTRCSDAHRSHRIPWPSLHRKQLLRPPTLYAPHSASMGDIDPATAWPCDRAQVLQWVPAEYLRPVGRPGGSQIDRTGGPRPGDRFLLTIPECMHISSRCARTVPPPPPPLWPPPPRARGAAAAAAATYARRGGSGRRRFWARRRRRRRRRAIARSRI